jgi:hypothetical protein
MAGASASADIYGTNISPQHHLLLRINFNLAIEGIITLAYIPSPAMYPNTRNTTTTVFRNHRARLVSLGSFPARTNERTTHIADREDISNLVENMSDDDEDHGMPLLDDYNTDSEDDDIPSLEDTSETKPKTSFSYDEYETIRNHYYEDDDDTPSCSILVTENGGHDNDDQIRGYNTTYGGDHDKDTTTDQEENQNEKKATTMSPIHMITHIIMRVMEVQLYGGDTRLLEEPTQSPGV